MSLLRDGVPFVLSAITIWSMFLAGDKNPVAWLMSLGNQALWLTWIIVIGAWGLLPMNIAMWYVAYRNWRLWVREQELQRELAKLGLGTGKVNFDSIGEGRSILLKGVRTSDGGLKFE